MPACRCTRMWIVVPVQAPGCVTTPCCSTLTPLSMHVTRKWTEGGSAANLVSQHVLVAVHCFFRALKSARRFDMSCRVILGCRLMFHWETQLCAVADPGEHLQNMQHGVACCTLTPKPALARAYPAVALPTCIACYIPGCLQMTSCSSTGARWSLPGWLFPTVPTCQHGGTPSLCRLSSTQPLGSLPLLMARPLTAAAMSRT
jgi:hypothetical protein